MGSSPTSPSMRWKIKKYPQIGAKRAKLKFAFLPTQTCDEMIVWLEKYLCFEFFKANPVTTPLWVVDSKWSQSSTMWNEWHEKL